MGDDKIRKWVSLVVKSEDVSNYTIDVQETNKQDGYLGNVTFVTVIGKNKSGNEKVLDLVIKSSKESNNFRKQAPIQECFEKEIYIYDKVKSAFNQFQQEREVEVVDVIPHCYVTEATGTSELLILENIKPQGYGLWDRFKPMDFDHLKMTLEAYAKWHALSFALKNQQPEVFEKLIASNNRNIFSEWILMAKMIDFIFDKFNKSKEKLIRNNEVETLKKIDFDRDEIKYIVSDSLFEDPEHSVILHGDCWTNNFMFKYDKFSSKPLDIRIIDWQCSGVGSPVIDLSFFLYSCCSKEDYQDLEGLLKIYHKTLADLLTRLGCDPDTLFSFNTLMDHWKRFSRYGIVVTSFIMRFSLCDLEEPPDFAAAAERGQDLLSSYDFTLKNEDRYLERVTNNLLNYAQNV